MSPSDRGKNSKPPQKEEKSKDIEFVLEFTHTKVVETLKKDTEDLMNHLNKMRIIISQRYKKELEIVRIMNKLEREVKAVTDRMKSEAEKDFSSVIRQPCQACQSAGRT